ncbi:MAG: hypothetical protein H6673_08280 [Anaerolineales bacterium]|nr:hypothetical protein [Anaerolineales bacterium]
MFTRYLRLFTLHAVEQNVGHQRLLRARLVTVRYSLEQMSAQLNIDWQHNPQNSINQARNEIVPRQQLLVNNDDLWHALWEEAPRWEPYRELRERHALPSLAAPPSRALTPYPVSTFSRRLDQTERLLQLTRTALEVANAGLILWQTWRHVRDERYLLHDALRATIEGQEMALEQASDADFVQHYLQAYGDDPVYPILFSEDSDV